MVCNHFLPPAERNNQLYASGRRSNNVEVVDNNLVPVILDVEGSLVEDTSRPRLMTQLSSVSQPSQGRRKFSFIPLNKIHEQVELFVCCRRNDRMNRYSPECCRGWIQTQTHNSITVSSQLNPHTRFEPATSRLRARRATTAQCSHFSIAGRTRTYRARANCLTSCIWAFYPAVRRTTRASGIMCPYFWSSSSRLPPFWPAQSFSFSYFACDYPK